MRVAGRVALLSLGVSVLPFVAQAQPRLWVYGVAERTAAEAEEGNVWFSGEVRDAYLTPQALGQRRLPPPPPPPPKPSPGTGAAIVVGVVDTGVDLDHPEFAGRIAAGGTCFGGVSVCSGAAALGDDNQGHGTHVAGIIGAAANGVGNTGVAPNALLLPVKVLDANGSGSYSAVASGISYAASHGARVINMSLGGSSASTTLLTPLQQAATTSVIVAAAGNSGNALAPGYPAAYATQAGVVGSMIIVGSVGPTNLISSFSQTPGTGGCVAVGAKTTCFKDVFLVAPGQSIYSTYMGGGYATMSGTSMATPYVSGVAARVLTASPYLTPQQVVSILLQSATDLGAPGTDAVYGRGLVNLQAALAPIGSQTIATSGANTGNFSGPGNVSTAGLSGVLAAGLQNSAIAKDVVFFDSFGRDYRTNLSAAAAAHGFSVDAFVTQNMGYWRSVALVGDGFSIAGFVSGDSNPVLGAREYSQVGDVVVRASLTDDATLILGRDASPTGRLNQLDLAASEAYDGLFMSASALNSPFIALTQEADFLGAGVRLSDGVALTIGHARMAADVDAALADETLTVDETYAHLTQNTTHMRSAQNTVAALSWRFAPWGAAGLNIARMGEQNSLLGGVEQGALALTADAATTSIGFGARVNLGDDWVASASWSRGQTDAAAVANGLVQSFSTIESEAYGLALAKHGVFGKADSIGVAVSRPLHITAGSALITASTGVNDARDILYSTEAVNLASSTPETDYEIGYTAMLGDRVKLQASAMYQQDVGGAQSEDAVGGFVTLTANW